MSEPKTRETSADAGDFLNSIEDERARADCWRIAELMSAATAAEPVMWGSSIVGFGRQSLRYASGRDADWPIVGFAPRKSAITLYLSDGEERDERLLARLGKHKTGKGCLYVKRLADVDENVLIELIEESVRRAKK